MKDDTRNGRMVPGWLLIPGPHPLMPKPAASARPAVSGDAPPPNAMPAFQSKRIKHRARRLIS